MKTRVARVLFTDVNSALRVSSRGAFEFQTARSNVTVVVIDDVTDKSGCYYIDWAISANAALSREQSLSYLQYTYQVYILPKEGGYGKCQWTGVAALGCKRMYCMAWVRDVGTSGVFAHELGHLLGMGHASTDSNNDGAVDCEYCDVSCNMAADVTRLKYYNMQQRVEMGWVRPIENPNRTVTLLSASFSNGSAVMISRNNVRYLISLRTAHGLDTSFVKTPTIYIHRGSLTTRNTLLLAQVAVNIGTFVSSVHKLQLTFWTQSPTAVALNVFGDSKACLALPQVQWTVVNGTVNTCGVTPGVELSARASMGASKQCGTAPVFVSAPCVFTTAARTCVNVTVHVQTDRFPSEVTWRVKVGGVVVAANTLNAPVTARLCDYVGTKAVFSITDTRGDGLCCQYGYGSYMLFSNGILIARGGSYTYNDTVHIPICPFAQDVLRMSIRGNYTTMLTATSRGRTVGQTPVRVTSACSQKPSKSKTKSRSESSSITTCPSRTSTISRSKRVI